MLRIGFDMKDDGETIFHCKCEKCGLRRIKTLR